MSLVKRLQNRERNRRGGQVPILDHPVNPSVARHPSPFLKPAAFTLIELLVVISIVGLLMALLLPALSRVRKQARNVTCQANLRQWGIIIYEYTIRNHDKFFDNAFTHSDIRPVSWLDATRVDDNDLLLCPMATRPAPRNKYNLSYGNTSTAWSRWQSEKFPRGYVGSYGTQGWIGEAVGDPLPVSQWLTPLVAGAERIPVLADCATPYGPPIDALWAPPVYEDDCVLIGVFCLNRHDGAINTLFMDWSVRKVGLKELWTLKWGKPFDTAGPWTKAGGVQPEDWPAWMRRFKDY